MTALQVAAASQSADGYKKMHAGLEKQMGKIENGQETPDWTNQMQGLADAAGRVKDGR